MEQRSIDGLMDESESRLNLDRVPFSPHLPEARQVAAALAVIALVGPAGLGGIPVLPVTFEDEKRRQQDIAAEIVESTVSTYASSDEAAAALVVAQQRLAIATLEIENVQGEYILEEDVIRAANRVLSGEVTGASAGRFRSAFTRVARDSVDLYILRDNEAWEAEQAEIARNINYY